MGKGVLNIYGLRLTSLPELPADLKILNCSNTPISQLPNLPAGLKTLVCSNTLIHKLPILPDGLRYLDCSGTFLTEMPELPRSLIYLDCSSAPLRILRYTDEDISNYNRRWQDERETMVRCIQRCQSLKEDIIAGAMAPDHIVGLYKKYGHYALETFYVC